MSDTYWQGRPVFVTGATGLLGGWLTRRLVDEQADLVCLVRDWVPQSLLVGSGTIGCCKVVRGDVLDRDLLERVLVEYEIDTVFHLAAQTVVRTANANPVSTLETNIRGTWNLLEACRRVPAPKAVVVASSDKAYGAQETLPYREETPLQGRHPYDVSKSCADLISQAFAMTYHLPLCITRCGNLYGGGDLNWNRIVPGTIRSVLGGERPVIRSDGRYVRDYFYVEDAAAAYIELAKRLACDSSIRGTAFNFSSGQPVSVAEIVGRILGLLHSSLQPEIRNEATNEIRAQTLCSERARRVLNWAPLFSLEEGLGRTIGWYKEFLQRE